MKGEQPIPPLLCGLCLGRQRPNPNYAVTIINGQAVCRNHISFAIRGKDYAEAIDLAIFQNELRRKRMDYISGREADLQIDNQARGERYGEEGQESAG